MHLAAAVAPQAHLREPQAARRAFFFCAFFCRRGKRFLFVLESRPFMALAFGCSPFAPARAAIFPAALPIVFAVATSTFSLSGSVGISVSVSQWYGYRSIQGLVSVIEQNPQQNQAARHPKHPRE
jgi:hypothetical protein